MAGTTRTTASRAAKTAGPGEILVPVAGELIPYRERQAEFDGFRSRGGVPLAAWSANRVAGMTLARTQGSEALELWAYADGENLGHVLLARFTRKTNGTVPHVEIVGAARVPGVVAVVPAAGAAEADEDSTTE